MNLFRKKSEKLENSVLLPQSYRFFVRHIQEGIVSYETGKKKDRVIFLSQAVLNEMDKTFTGKPIYINHIDSETASESEAQKTVGTVVKSFYNSADGWHWAEIMVDETGAGVLRKGWKVSNAHRVTQMGSEGLRNNTHFDNEVLMSEYEHLALTPSPRYEDSIVLTPDEFKRYNDERIKEIESLKNSKEIDEMDLKTLLNALTSLRNAVDEVTKELDNGCGEEKQEENSVAPEEKKDEPKAENSEDKADDKADDKEEAKAENAEEEPKEEAKDKPEDKEENANDSRELIREIAAVAGKADEDFEGGEEEKIATLVKLASQLKADKPEENSSEEGKGKEEAPAEENAKDKEEKADEKEAMKNSLDDHFDDLHNAKAKKVSSETAIQTEMAGYALGKKRYG